MIDSRPRVKQWARRSHDASCLVAMASTRRAVRVWCKTLNPPAPRSDTVVFISVYTSYSVLPRDLHDMRPEQPPPGAVDRLLGRTLAWPTLASGLEDIYDRPFERSRCGGQLAYHIVPENGEQSPDGRMLRRNKVVSSTQGHPSPKALGVWTPRIDLHVRLPSDHQSGIRTSKYLWRKECSVKDWVTSL